MKQLLFLFLICTSHILSAQNQLTETQKLVATAKVWGFLKYYHPAISSGEYNWDAELFKILPQVKAAQSKKELSKIFLACLDRIGPLEKCLTCKAPPTEGRFLENFDLSWLEDKKLLSKKLSKQLKEITESRYSSKQHYVKALNSGNLSFQNEKSYEDYDWQDQNIRLLALFRYWNFVEYFFPYKYQTDVAWDEVLEKMLPEFLNAKSEMDFHLALLKLIVATDDSHSIFSTDLTQQFIGSKFIPVKAKYIEDKLLITAYYNQDLAAANGLQLGDLITKVEGVAVKKIFEAKLPYISGSNIEKKITQAARYILCGNTDSVDLEILRGNQTIQKKVARFPYQSLNYQSKESTDDYKILDHNIGYLNLDQLEKNEVKAAMKELSSTNGLIIDIRNYPKGVLYELIPYFSSSKKPFVKFIIPDLKYPGQYIWTEFQAVGSKKLKYKQPIVLLVNASTQSHAEFTTICLQTADMVTTIGSQSSGADGNVDRIEILSGLKTMISGIGVFYPDGTETQRVGVKIDIEVKASIQGLQAGRDEVLERAIQELKAKN
jgi:carboxyl-terminal processing protease